MGVILEAGTAIYVALAVALAVWVGIFIYLLRIDSHARELRRRIERQAESETPTAPKATLRRAENREQRTENREQGGVNQEQATIDH